MGTLTTALFDMDGVLIDSVETMKRSWKSVCQDFELSIPFEEYHLHIGKPFKDILVHLDVDKGMHSGIQLKYGEYARRFSGLVCSYKGINRLLRLLHIYNFKVGVVTSKEHWRAEDIIENFLLFSEILVTPELTCKGKPSAEPLIYAMDKLKSEPDETFYVGDMTSDKEAAEEAGVLFMKANWGYGDFSHRGIHLDAPDDILDILGIGY